MKKPVVALIGRPNVGKSTLFNRIVGKKISIIEDTPGVTRDRIYATAQFMNHAFYLIDTGGLSNTVDTWKDSIKIQVEMAIDEADFILFVVDGKEGLTSDDHIVKHYLRKTNKPIYVVINKMDSKLFQEHLYDFYELGFEHYFPVSGEQNDGIFDLLSALTEQFPMTEKENDTNTIKFSILGRPNVGKSSLVNAILNEDRVIVSPIAGTTRDAIDTNFTYHNEEFTVIDTAGLRKKGKIYEKIEKYSLLRTLRAIDRSDVCVIVINAFEGIIEHDKHIAGYAIEAAKGIVIVVNKWDLMPQTEEAIKQFKKDIQNQFPFLSYAPIVFLSALTKKRMHLLMPEIIKAYQNSKKRISTSILNDVLNDAYLLNLPPSYKGKRLKIYFSSQVQTQPPTFQIQVNNKGLVHFSYERYLENKIRESFDFEGTPIIIQFKNKGEQEL